MINLKDFEKFENHYVKTKREIMTYSEVGPDKKSRRQGEKIKHLENEILLFDSVYSISNSNVDVVLIDSNLKIRYLMIDTHYSSNDLLYIYESCFEIIE